MADAASEAISLSEGGVDELVVGAGVLGAVFPGAAGSLPS